MTDHKKKKPKYEPRHAAPKTCPHTWTEKGPYPHDNHFCGNKLNHGGSHNCGDWNCSATN